MPRKATVDTPVDGQQVAARVVNLLTERGSFYNDRKAAIALVDTKTTKPNRLKLTKVLIDPKTFEDINALDYDFDRRIEAFVLPSHFRRGVYTVSLAAFEQVNALCAKYVDDRAEVARRFAYELYPPEREKAREDLGDQWKATDYPAPNEVFARFHFSFRWFESNVPGSLRDFAPDAYRAEAQKLRDAVQQAAEDMRQYVRVAFSEFCSLMKDKMTPSTDGRKKLLHASTLDQFNEFIHNFPLRDVTNDRMLQGYVDEVRRVMAGADISAVKTDQNLRALITQTMSNITAALEPLITKRPTRAIDTDQAA